MMGGALRSLVRLRLRCKAGPWKLKIANFLPSFVRRGWGREIIFQQSAQADPPKHLLYFPEYLSFRRKPESSIFKELWIPTFVGMTFLEVPTNQSWGDGTPPHRNATKS